MEAAVLIIYTGGTIGMKEDPATGALVPFAFHNILEEVPELKNFKVDLDTISLDPLVDSSDVQPPFWAHLAEIIRDHYAQYIGFVILHGTDTMAYSAAALSYMLEDLEKPVVFTGSQLPLGALRTDGKENLISAIEIAAARDAREHALVPEVCIFFQNQLFRGNRSTKDNAEEFHAFRSPNYPPLAEAGIHLKYNKEAIHHPEVWGRPLLVHPVYSTQVALLKVYPGLQEKNVEAMLQIPGLRGLVLETYGSGNAPTAPWLLHRLEEAVARGLVILNISQCPSGSVCMEAYATGIRLKEAGVLSGKDLTTEAAITKLMFLTGYHTDNKSVKQDITQCLRGEFSNS